MKYITANYHTHTERCHHATGSEREYIENAIAGGLKTLGFADHAPQFFDGNYYSTYRMLPSVAPEYVQTLRDLKEEYKGKIDIKIGFEAEYAPKHFDEFVDLCDTLSVDYLILGQHFIGEEPEGQYSTFNTTNRDILKRYIDQVITGISTGRFMYVAHPDVINFKGNTDVYQQEVERLCKAAKKLDIPLEINLLGIRDSRFYPNPLFWEVAGQTGCTAVLGCDAHDPKAVNDEASEAKALIFAENYGVKVLKDIK